MTNCKHGLRLDDCPLCEKRVGECDFGACTLPAIVVLDFGRERRAVCAGHIEAMQQTTAQPSLIESFSAAIKADQDFDAACRGGGLR